jgi:hypothetical protein
MAELEVLRCSGCNAPLVLGDADSIACASCGVQTPVPGAYRELVRARSDDAGLRADAERVLRGLDRPPGLVVKVLARVLDQPMLAFLLLYGVPATLYAIAFGLRANRWLAPRLHVASPDDVPLWMTVFVISGVLFAIAFVPRVLGVYANRRATGRARLLASLRARPPEVAGGPSACRLCGAPLAVATDAIVATCSYCRAENAVVVATPLVEAFRRAVGTLGKTIADVALRDRAERRLHWRSLVKELGRYALRTVLLGTGFAFATQETSEHRPTVPADIAIVATPILFIYLIYRSVKQRATDDGAARREANDVPGWVGVVGPLVLLVVVLKYMHL